MSEHGGSMDRVRQIRVHKLDIEGGGSPCRITIAATVYPPVVWPKSHKRHHRRGVRGSDSLIRIALHWSYTSSDPYPSGVGTQMLVLTKSFRLVGDVLSLSDARSEHVDASKIKLTRV